MSSKLGTELASVADAWNVFERIHNRGNGSEYLCLPYGGRAERLAHLYLLIRDFDSVYYFTSAMTYFVDLPQIEIGCLIPVNTSARPPV
jgi:hypothetical protein